MGNMEGISEVTDALIELELEPSAAIEESMSWLERFVVLMYDNTSDTMEINEARKQLFAHKGRTLEDIPPFIQILSESFRFFS